MLNIRRDLFAELERLPNSGEPLPSLNMKIRNIEFSDYIHRPGIKKQTKGNTTFRKLDLFPSLGAGKSYSVGSLRKS
jgi:hypothetical protein